MIENTWPAGTVPPRILAYPARSIAYLEGFYGAMRRKGYEVVDGQFAVGWTLSEVRPGDVAHFHWPSFAYRGSGGASSLLKRWLRFVFILVLLRVRGARVVWTAHNLLPHDPCPLPILDRLSRRVMIGLAELVLVHGPSALAIIRQSFYLPDQKVALIPHGHFAEMYGPPPERELARRELDLKLTDKVVLFLGACMPYKNVDGLITAFKSSADANSVLLVAGRFSSVEYETTCRSVAAADPRVIIRSGFVPDDALPSYLCAADCFVVPYREILTSGSAVLAASYGLPVISIDRGFLRDFIGQGMGLLFDADKPGALQWALSQALAQEWNREDIAQRARLSCFGDAVDIMMYKLARR